MSSFREQLIEFARRGIKRVPQCNNEECTKLYLVLPFLQLLGYDPNDPDEIAAEHSADFSDKYKNRVDFLLKADGVAAIALECKPCGWDLKEDRGQLKAHSNAALSPAPECSVASSPVVCAKSPPNWECASLTT